MPLLSTTALAMWWEVAAAARADFEHWHSSEHLPERLGVPGFLRGARWSALPGTRGYFALYEIAGPEVVASDAYRRRLDQPSAWTRRVMPHFRHMVRSRCDVRASCGGGVARVLLTLRFAPVAGAEPALRRWIADALLPTLAARTGVTGAHLLENLPLAPQPPTVEQQLRGGSDAAADWAVLVAATEARALEGLRGDTLRDDVLAGHGAAPGCVGGLYQIDHALTAQELAT